MRAQSEREQENTQKQSKTGPYDPSQREKKTRRASSEGKESISSQTDLLPVEAIITVTEHEWIWQVVDKSMLSTLSHRIILDNPTLGRRELVMTSGIDAAVGVARTVTEIEGGCVLIETLDP